METLKEYSGADPESMESLGGESKAFCQHYDTLFGFVDLFSILKCIKDETFDIFQEKNKQFFKFQICSPILY